MIVSIHKLIFLGAGQNPDKISNALSANCPWRLCRSLIWGIRSRENLSAFLFLLETHKKLAFLSTNKLSGCLFLSQSSVKGVIAYKCRQARRRFYVAVSVPRSGRHARRRGPRVNVAQAKGISSQVPPKAVPLVPTGSRLKSGETNRSHLQRQAQRNPSRC